MANDIAPCGQLTTASEVENFPSFPLGIKGGKLTDWCRAQSPFRAQIHIETDNKVDFASFPFKVFTPSKAVFAESVIVAARTVAKRLNFHKSDTFWNRGISGC